MNNKRFNNFLKDPQTNWKYILIVMILAFLVGGGILGYSRWIERQEVKISELKIPEKVVEPEKVFEDETAEWKTYRNLDYGYEIKYPLEATGSESGNGILIENLPVSEETFKKKFLKIYIGNNIPEESCYSVEPKAGEPTYATINNWKVLIFRGITGGQADWSAFNAHIYIRETNQCITFELIFEYSEAPKQPPPVNNEGETKVLYQVISTLSIFEPQERYVKVISPNGGEQLTAGGKYVISWDAKNVKKIDIRLAERISEESRTYATERLIANDFILTDENKYEWNIPADLPPSKYVLYISSDDGRKWVKDFSDNYFTISNTLSIQEKEKMLRQMFKGEFVLKGNEILSSVLKPYLYLYLEKIVEDSFVTPYAKEYLFIAQLAGVGHAGGLTHTFLGIFDDNKNLASIPVNIDSVPSFSSEVHFGGDSVDFGFYNCKGVKYIVIAFAGCPNFSCCFGSVSLFRINNGKFERIQTINEDSLAKGNLNLQSIIFPSAHAAAGPSYGLKMILSEEKIIVKKVPAQSQMGEEPCPESDYKVLNWNKNSCRFE